jgi:hypothetical protein
MHTWKTWTRASAIASGLYLFLAVAIGPAPRAQQNVPVPVYKVDPFWPKPFPNKWSSQQFVDVYVDKDDHVWALNRPNDARPDEMGALFKPPRECCVLGPEVMEFDTDGNVLKAWGGPSEKWFENATDIDPASKFLAAMGATHYKPEMPDHLQTLGVDNEGNVYVSSERPPGVTIKKYTPDGKFLWSFGHEDMKEPGQKVDPLNTNVIYGGIGAFDIDESAHELYITDSGAKRIVVYDMNTGAFKRGWGGHGIPLSEIDVTPVQPYDALAGPPPDEKQFIPSLHCVHISVDGLVYVCERNGDRVSVFTKQGKFVTSFYVRPSTPGRGKEFCGGLWSISGAPMCGSVVNLTFSHDPQEKYLLALDMSNNMVHILNRSDGKEVGSISGGNNHYAGNIRWPDGIAMDSMGNVYIGEVEDGKRIEKFILTNGDGKKTQPRPTPIYK